MMMIMMLMVMPMTMAMVIMGTMMAVVMMMMTAMRTTTAARRGSNSNSSSNQVRRAWLCSPHDGSAWPGPGLSRHRMPHEPHHGRSALGAHWPHCGRGVA